MLEYSLFKQFLVCVSLILSTYVGMVGDLWIMGLGRVVRSPGAVVSSSFPGQHGSNDWLKATPKTEPTRVIMGRDASLLEQLGQSVKGDGALLRAVEVLTCPVLVLGIIRALQTGLWGTLFTYLSVCLLFIYLFICFLISVRFFFLFRQVLIQLSH